MMAGERYRLACDRCAWSAETIGPHDDGAGGNVARLYCPACGATRDCALPHAAHRRGNTGPFGVPLGPRDGPAGHLARGLARRLRGRAAAASAGTSPICPACGEHDLVLAPAEETALLCPQCGVGRLCVKGK